MKTTIRTTALTIFAVITLITANSQTTYRDNGTNTTYTLANGDSLYIASGTFTGIINTWTAGSKITVAQNATFKPSSFADNKSKAIVYGTAVLPSLKTGAGFDLKNYGNLTVNGDAEMNGGAQTWFNNFGATMTFKGKVSINKDGSMLTNDGTITAQSDLYLYAVATINNTNTITVQGDFKTSKGTVNNSGKFYGQNAVVLSGSLVFNNTCKLIADKGILVDNNNTTVYNSGFMWASNSKSNSFITNSGTIINSGTAKMKSVDFTNWGTVRGNAWMYFTGVTTGSGTIGITGITTDSIRVYDVTRTNAATIFDNQWGTIRPNVKYSVFAAPDTSASAMTSCSAQFFSSNSMTTLPVVWNYFEAKLINAEPVLDWSAQQDPGTVYELERSYNNNSFTTINTVKSEGTKVAYQYIDKAADKNIATIYYRVKATEPNGQVKFTSVKVVKQTSNNGTTAQVYPNPFTNQFTIAYTTSNASKVTIRIYNTMGQASITKSVNAGNGRNVLTITEASQLSKGIYVVEVISGNEIIATQKIIKN